MPRLTIYVPDALALDLKHHPGQINISQVCAEAIRAELSARGTLHSIEGLFTAVFRNTSAIEEALMHKFRMRRVIAKPGGDDNPVETVASWGSILLNETVFEGLDLALGGGNQIWRIARRLEPRNLGMSIWSIGFGHVDRELPHVHPNALSTLISMLFGSRTNAMLVGAPDFKKYWVYPAKYPRGKNEVKRMIVGSCARFDADSPYARLLGDEITTFLEEEHVLGDFLGLFITPDGRILEPYTPSMTQSHIGATDMQEFAKRDDTLVLLAAAGGHKVRLIRQVLQLGLCNAIVTDEPTARALLAG